MSLCKDGFFKHWNVLKQPCHGNPESVGQNQQNLVLVPSPDRKGIQHKIEGVAGVVLTAIFSIGLATRDGTVDTIPDPFVQTKSRNITRQDRVKVWALPRGRSHMPATNRRWKWETPDQL